MFDMSCKWGATAPMADLTGSRKRFSDDDDAEPELHPPLLLLLLQGGACLVES